MITLRLGYIEDQLRAIGLEEIARRFNIENGYTKKIHARDLLLGFLLLYNQGENSLEHWASCIESFSGEAVSKQAVALRCDKRHAYFFEEVARALIREALQKEAHRANTSVDEVLGHFERVLLGDSTCFALDADLAAAFPSSYSHKGKAATARLQLTYELKSEQFAHIDVGSYRDNDQGYSQQVVCRVGPGDLVIRDLGYFSLDAFEALSDKKAFFLSRLRFGVAVLDPRTKAPVDLLEGLRTSKHETIDIDVLLGQKKQLPVRLVAQRLPEKVAEHRRRKAKARRDRRCRYSKDYAEWLGWAIFVTNVPREKASLKQLIGLYRLRWRIEIIFKSFKSCFRAAELLKGRRMPPARVRITLFGWLCYTLLILRPAYGYFADCLKAEGRYVSLLKFCTWLRIHLVELLLSEQLAEYLSAVRRHCTYEQRRKRKHHIQHLQAIGFP